MLKLIRNILIFIILFGICTAGIDYFRMNTGNVPLFNISSYKSKDRIQSYRGLFYQGSRKCTVSSEEPLVDSSNITFTVLFWDINVPSSYKDIQEEFTIETKESSICTNSELVYADLNIKVYTYCLDEINIVKDNKKLSLYDYMVNNNDLIDDIDYHMGYMGLYDDSRTVMLNSRDDNFTNNGLSMFRCNNTNINDVYIGPKNMQFQDDFCTYKDDDFKFIYKIEEIPKEEIVPSLGEVQVIEENQKEVFYEDFNYIYEFDEIKSNRVFIVTPEVRGKSEVRIPIKDALSSNIVTIDELKSKGLKFNRIEKNS